MIVPLQCLVRLICDCAVLVQLIHLWRDGATHAGECWTATNLLFGPVAKRSFCSNG